MVLASSPLSRILAKMSPNKTPVRVLPANINHPPYSVTLIRAEQLVASGLAVWTPGLRQIRETRVVARGERREWQKTISYDPETGAKVAVMQLVVPRSRTPRKVLIET